MKKGNTMSTIPAPPVKYTVNVSELGNPKHFEQETALDLVEVCKLFELGLSIEDMESESPTAQMLAWASWLWVRREHAPGLSWDDAQERIRLVFA
jgi:hypothetical protein